MTFSLRFSDVAELRNEKVDPATCSGSRYIGLEHIEQDSLSLSGWGTAEDVDSQKQRFYEGDILFGKLRPYFRKVVIAPFDGICSTDIWVVKPVVASDRDFVFYWMASDGFVTRATNASEGTRMPRAKWDWVSCFELPATSLENRRTIGRILRTIDEKISVNRSISKTQEETAQAIFKSWFVDFDPVKAKMAGEKPVGMDDATAALFPDSMEDSELGPIPKGWECKTADNIFSVGIGRTPPRKEPEWFCEGGDGVDWVSIRDMGSYGVFSSGTSEGLTEEAVKKFRVPIVPKGTVLMSFKLTVGKLCITDRDLVTNEAIAHFKQNESSPISSLFAYLWLSNHDMESLDSTSSIGTATNSGLVKAIKFLIPSEHTISHFESLASPLFNQIESLTAQSRKLVELRDSLLPRLISGELRIPDEMLVS